MTDEVIDTELDDETKDRLDSIADEITPDWMDDPATRQETIKFLARYYYGEADV